MLLSNTFTSDLPGAALGGNDTDRKHPVGGCNEGGINVMAVNVPLTEAHNKDTKRLQMENIEVKVIGIHKHSWYQPPQCATHGTAICETCETLKI